MRFVGHFIGTNRSDKAHNCTRVDCSPSAASRILYLRAPDLTRSASEPGKLF